MRTHPRKLAVASVILLTVISVWLSSAHATRVLKRDLGQLTGESAVIIIGTVVSVSYEPDPKEGVTFTKVRLERLRAVKGEQHIQRAGNGLTLWFQGGLAADGAMEHIVGMPQLRLGETYLLFLRGGEWTMNPVAGWHQGGFRLVPGPGKGSQIVLTLDDAIVMRVHERELELHPLRYGQLFRPPDVSRKDQRGEIQLLTKPGPSSTARQRSESIYLEDNTEELEKQDRQRVAQAQRTEERQQARERPQSEDARDKTPEREQRMIQLLGRKPIDLSEFIEMIQQLEKEVASQYSAQPFHSEPIFLPRKIKSLSPPQPERK